MPIRTNRGRAAVYRRLWGWPLRSPRHLVVFVVVFLVLVIAIGIGVTQLRSGRTGGSSSGSGSTGASSTASSTAGKDSIRPGTPSSGSESTSLTPRLTEPSPSSLTAAPPDAVLEVATKWAMAWVNHPDGITTEAWLSALRPLSTEEQITTMETVDPANVPASAVTGAAVATANRGSSVVVAVPTDGGALRVELIATPQGWRVSSYEPGS
jgi:hypothetical protein